MRGHIIKTIYFKELREVIRDRRMLFLIILLPFFLYPVLFALIGKVGQTQMKKMSSKKILILMNPEGEGTEIYSLLAADPTLEVRLQSLDAATLDTMKNSLGIRVAPDFTTALAANGSGQISILGDFSEDLLDGRKRSIRRLVEGLNQQLLNVRLQENQLPNDFAQPISIQEENLASKERQIGQVIGGFIPFILLIFIFTGSVYIAIDITAGEKERRTLQTIFTAPISIREIIAGKFLAVFSVGLLSAFMNIASMLFALTIQMKLMTEGALGSFSLAVSAQGWLWLVLIILFSTIFIAALNLAIVLLANSYKEAQSYVSPLMMIIIIPAVLSQMPGMELDTSTALIPILNIALALAAIVKGGFDVGLVAMVTGFTLAYAALALYIATLTFSNESVITGEKVNLKEILTPGKKGRSAVAGYPAKQS